MRSLPAIALVLLSAPGLADIAAVRTDTGLVQGVLDDEVIVYKGIPFAAPPAADLRWKAPQPAKHWDGIRKASAPNHPTTSLEATHCSTPSPDCSGSNAMCPPLAETPPG